VDRSKGQLGDVQEEDVQEEDVQEGEVHDLPALGEEDTQRRSPAVRHRPQRASQVHYQTDADVARSAEGDSRVPPSRSVGGPFRLS
jgi:hypothetical protein